jgi:hypothetical protein
MIALQQLLLQRRKTQPRFGIFHRHHFLEFGRLPKRRKPLRQSRKTELIAQQRNSAEVGVRHFNWFVFERQNELTEAINSNRRPHRRGRALKHEIIRKSPAFTHVFPNRGLESFVRVHQLELHC